MSRSALLMALQSHATPKEAPYSLLRGQFRMLKSQRSLSLGNDESALFSHLLSHLCPENLL